MRLAVYGAASTVAASGVILSAFAQRANFYSAMVYLAQSNACLMVLTNFSLLLSLLIAHGVQRLLYGRLRDLEVESLYEKAWYAVTETCLAMTIFRDEWNVGFVVCFAGLLFAKGFCWLSAGRVEMMEQTPPTNPRLFHTRLVSSLVLLILSDIAMIYHSVSVVLERGRPNMMVMFAFEFTILLISAISTAGRYGLIVAEKIVVNKQIETRRAARRVERALVNEDDPQAAIAEEEEDDTEGLVWEEKGTWLFYLELGTDFLKLLTYLSFFLIVLTFYGLPLHIIRDVYLTLRSFISRIRDFIRYRRATNDMHARYPDATAEEVERENVCIICREEMRAWTVEQETQNGQGAQAGGAARIGSQQQQRMRPKKLPCGHILHFACLRSWLERQQRCPTCRRPVLENAQANDPTDPNNINRQQPGGQQGPGGRGIAWGGQFGGIRVNFGVGQGPEFMQNVLNQWEQNRPPGAPGAGPGMPGNVGQQQAQQGQTQQNPAGPVPLPQNNQQQQLGQPQQQQSPMHQQQGQQPAVGMASLVHLHNQLLELERSLRRELEAVVRTSAQVGVVRGLQDMVTQNQPTTRTQSSAFASTSEPAPEATIPSTTQPNLPQGITLPPGWNLIPLNPSTTIRTDTPGAAQLIRLPATGDSPALDAIDLRRRRLGRGDVRVYNSNLRDWHASRSPGVERDESESGLSGVLATAAATATNNSSSSNTAARTSSPNTDPADRASYLLRRAIALEESNAIVDSVVSTLRAATTSNSVPLITTLPRSGGQLAPNDIALVEQDMQESDMTRRELLSTAAWMLREAEAVLDVDEENRNRKRESTAAQAQPQQNPPAATCTTAATISQSLKDDKSSNVATEAQSMTRESSSSSHVNVETPPAEEVEQGDKGKGRAVTVEDAIPDLE